MLAAYSGGKISVENISDANDSQVLQQLLQEEGPVFDAQDAGTSFRFLTTYLACIGKTCVLTGTNRMKQRPIAPLVDALRKLGAQIDYLENEGYPPLSLKGFPSGQLCSELTVDASVSSQYISSLMLAAPLLAKGLRLTYSNQVSSASYIELTWNLMERLGFQGNLYPWGFDIPHQSCPGGRIVVESDWSSLCYWLAFAALFPGPVALHFSNVHPNSSQGDAGFLALVRHWGVQGNFEGQNLFVSRSEAYNFPENLEVDMNLMPDQGQTLIALCAASGVEARISGLKSLAIKETNRLLAMQHELGKLGILIEVDEKNGTCYLPGNQKPQAPAVPFQTYDDHRMAMALSLFSLRFPEGILLEEPSVVRKSYPGFWSELEIAGFHIQEMTDGQ